MRATSRGVVGTYLAERDAASKAGLPRGRGARVLRRVSTPGMRGWAKVNGTLLLGPLSRRAVRRLLSSDEKVQLNLGSGPQRIPGWINVDILGMGADLYWDLRRGIPFPDESVRAVFLEHVLEHFRADHVLRILEECHRALVPGGIVRVGVPDFGRYMESYAGDREFVERLRPGRPTPLLAVAEVALYHGHRSIWDGETLALVIDEVGFSEVEVRNFGDSALEPAPDTSPREAESVYVEGRKPTA